MSRSPCFFVERYDKRTDWYELQHPYIWNDDHSKLIPADLFPYNGCHDLFDIVEQKEMGFPSMNGIHHGLPKDSTPEIEKEYNNCYNIENKDSWHPQIYWFTYADMYIYCLEHPQVQDYESEEDGAMKSNPIFLLKKRVDAFLEVMDAWDIKNDYSLIRIVYWIG